MLSVTIRDNGFTIEGHAGYAEHGKDIICSAVSFMAQTLAQELHEYCLIDLVQKSGYMDVKLLTKCDASTVLLEYFENSVGLLTRQYPENVQIKKK